MVMAEDQAIRQKSFSYLVHLTQKQLSLLVLIKLTLNKFDKRTFILSKGEEMDPKKKIARINELAKRKSRRLGHQKKK